MASYEGYGQTGKIPGVMIAAVKSGSGKTTVTCALLEALKRRGFHPHAYKCGPDYIDPMFHRTVLGIPSHNLDSFFLGTKELRDLYLAMMEGEDAQKTIAVVEGAMGLFDGLGGIKVEGSAYDVACILKLPVILLADAHGIGCSIIPLLSGFLQYDKEKRIKGVILNQISESFYRILAPLIEETLEIPVLGFLPRKKELALESRHLGLKLPEEIHDLKEQLGCGAEILESNVAVDRILSLAAQAGAVYKDQIVHPFQTGDIRIGVARDQAFCFYYEENLRLLESMGAKLVFFSPVHDKKLPENLSGLLLGGGYPELYAKELEENHAMRASVRAAIEGGMPSLAECGGFIYLHERLTDEKGAAFFLCGVVPGACFYRGKSVRFGYLELKEKESRFLPEGVSIRGHEFHYYDSEENGDDCIAVKPVTGRSWACVHSGPDHFWGFPHLYYPSAPEFARNFIEKAKQFSATVYGDTSCLA